MSLYNMVEQHVLLGKMADLKIEKLIYSKIQVFIEGNDRKSAKNKFQGIESVDTTGSGKSCVQHDEHVHEFD